jgi:hypothetical protein
VNFERAYCKEQASRIIIEPESRVPILRVFIEGPY